MKNILNLCILAALLIAPTTFADNTAQMNADSLNGYFSKQHPLKSGNLKAALNKAQGAMVSPTDIIVNNATFNPIYVNVVEGGFTDVVNYRGYDHVFNDRGAFKTKITIYDPNNVPYFTQVLCPRASVTVYGYTPYDVVVDVQSCKR